MERYQQIVFETAEFMASYPAWDEANHRYVLGPAMIPAQESYGSDKARNLNPTFELAYWHWGLETAQKWRQRLGLEREPKWDSVIQRAFPPEYPRRGVHGDRDSAVHDLSRSSVDAGGIRVCPADSADRPERDEADIRPRPADRGIGRARGAGITR